MRRLSSAKSWVGVAMAASRSSAMSCELLETLADHRCASAPSQHGFDRTGLRDRENDDRHQVLAGKREGGGVHHFEPARDRLLMRDAVETVGRGVLLGVGRI